MTAVLIVVTFVTAMIALSAYLRRRDREGDWDKEGFGAQEHQEPGLKYRPLEAPPRAPYD